MVPMEDKRYFTVAEVNRLIPELERRVERILQQRAELRQRIREVHQARAAGAGPGELMRLEAEVDFLVTLLRAAYRAIEEELGGVIKAEDATLVDFLGRGPAGEDVWLCWRYGERRIEYYHPLDEGFAGRRPIVPGM